MYVTGGVVLGFLLHPVHHLDPAWIALFGATLLCILSEPHDVHELLHVSFISQVLRCCLAVIISHQLFMSWAMRLMCSNDQ